MLKNIFNTLSNYWNPSLFMDSPTVAKLRKAINIPKLDWEIGCRECHKDATPDVYIKWEASRHGEMNFGCYICHGDGQEVFYKRAKMTAARVVILLKQKI